MLFVITFVLGVLLSLYSQKKNSLDLHITKKGEKKSVINCYPYSFMDNVCQ